MTAKRSTFAPPPQALIGQATARPAARAPLAVLRDGTAIQWADYTFNGWIGCEKVSAGCKHCYAEVDTFARVQRGKGIELWGANGERHVTSDANWAKPLRWNVEARGYFDVTGKRRRVFASSLCDVFEDRRDLDAPRERLFELIEETPHLDWLLLTKRPGNMVHLAPGRWRAEWPTNVWAGCTVEDQISADARIPHLLRVPVAMRFLSCEPLLEAVDLSEWLFCDRCRVGEFGPGALSDDLASAMGGRPWRECRCSELSWIIVGGESGGKARPFDVAWPRSIVKQCRDANVAPFVKQFGAHVIWNGMSRPGEHWPTGTRQTERHDVGFGNGWRVRLKDSHGGEMAEWPEDLRVRQFPEVAHAH